MNVLQITNAYPTIKNSVYGIFIKEQIESLKDLNINSELYFINGKEEGKLAYLKAFFNLKSKFDAYDLIHCHHFLTAALVLTLKPKVPVLVTFLSDGINEFIIPDLFFNELIKKKLYRFILKNSSGRIFKKSIPDFLKDDKLSFYLPNGVNIDFFKPCDKNEAKMKLNLDKDKTYILFSSLLDLKRKEKRYDIYHETIRILKEKRGREDIEELVIVNVERDKVPLYFNSASLHLLTSDFEGSPNSVKESLSCNTPVVTTNVGNVNELLSGLRNSYVSQSNNPEELADLCLKSLNSEHNENSGLNITKAGLDMKTKAVELVNIYKMILENVKR